MLVELCDLRFVLEDEHDPQTVVLGGRQEDELAKVADVLGVVGEVRVEYEVEVDVEVGSAHDGQPVGVPLLVEHEYTGAVLLPLDVLDVDEHLAAGHEEDDAVVLAEAAFQLLLE